jgi:Kef-type K+ transport system membrane component KefB
MTPPSYHFASFILLASGPGAVLFSLFLVFAAAKVAAELCERLRIPAVVGEISAGIVIGPSLLGWVQPNAELHLLGEIGIVFLLFLVGLETDPAALFKLGRAALLVALGGVAVPFVVGFLLFFGLGYANAESLFVGVALVATSVGVTARVLGAMGALDLAVSRLILAAAVIDDVLGLLFLGVVSGVVRGGVDLLQIGTALATSVGFILVVLLVGGRLARRAKPSIERLQTEESFFVVGVAVCLGLSALGAYAGVAAIVGAFLAGLTLSGVSEGTSLRRRSRTLMEFTVPFFLVGIGLNFDATAFAKPAFVGLVLLTTAAALVTKVVGCGLYPLITGDVRQGLLVGVGMMPRGEVGIIVAQIGLTIGILGNDLYVLIVAVAVLTTLATPPLLAALFKSAGATPPAPPTQVADEAGGYSEIG